LDNVVLQPNLEALQFAPDKQLLARPRSRLTWLVSPMAGCQDINRALFMGSRASIYVIQKIK
jgi:hypothetical protein